MSFLRFSVRYRRRSYDVSLVSLTFFHPSVCLCCVNLVFCTFLHTLVRSYCVSLIFATFIRTSRFTIFIFLHLSVCLYGIRVFKSLQRFSVTCLFVQFYFKKKDFSICNFVHTVLVLSFLCFSVPSVC